MEQSGCSWRTFDLFVVKIVVSTEESMASTSGARSKILMGRAFLEVTPLGFEPRTNGLKARCSAVELESRVITHETG